MSQISFKMAKKISVAAKMGGPDPSSNPQLSSAIETAKKFNVMKKVIENAIKRGGGGGKDEKLNLEMCLYEGMGPGGVSVIIQALTDNKTRTIGFIKPCFSKFGFSMSPTAYMFDKKGSIVIDRGDASMDELLDRALDAGAEDVIEMEPEEDGVECNLVEIITDPTENSRIAKSFQKDFEIKSVTIDFKPKPDLLVTIDNPDTQKSYDKFMNMIDDVDDVDEIYTNLKE